MKNNKLKNYRLEINEKQSKVAKQIGISKQHLSRLENNKQTGSVEVLQKLADYYGTTIDDLLKQDDT